MSNRVLWDGVDLGEFPEEDIASMRERVGRDWRVYARQAVNVTGVLVRAGAPTVGAFSTAAYGLIAVIGVTAPGVLSALLRTLSADNGVLLQLSAWLIGWPLIAGIVVGGVRSFVSPTAFGYENQFDREIVDRLVRRYTGSESAGTRRSGVTILRG